MAQANGILVYVGDDNSQTTFYPQTTGDNVLVKMPESTGLNQATLNSAIIFLVNMINELTGTTLGAMISDYNNTHSTTIDTSQYITAEQLQEILESQLSNPVSGGDSGGGETNIDLSPYVKRSDIVPSTYIGSITDYITTLINNAVNNATATAGTIPTSTPATIEAGSVWISN